MELRKGKMRSRFESLWKDRERSIEPAYRHMRRGHSIRTMPQLCDMFQEIYGGTLWGMNISDIAFHFVEEIGEVSKEISYLETICGGHSKSSWRDFTRDTTDNRLWEDYSVVCLGLMHELADIFSWQTALCFKACQLLNNKWESRDVLIKLYTNTILQEKGRGSVNVSTDTIRFQCRYCGNESCSRRCMQKQTRKRIRDGRNEIEKRFAYE
jgi:hypothetical protein